MSEEAIVSKTARVTGEVVVRKDSDTRTETVRDTVRRTEVEVERDDVEARLPGQHGVDDDAHGRHRGVGGRPLQRAAEPLPHPFGRGDHHEQRDLPDHCGEHRGAQPAARVQAAVDHFHAAMGDLQKATITHVFEMRSVLSPAQAEVFDAAVVEALHDDAG